MSWKNPRSGGLLGADSGALRAIFLSLQEYLAAEHVWIIPMSDETTAITTGEKVKWRAPYACKVTAIKTSLTTASSSGTPTVDLEKAGTSLLTTRPVIDVSETTSTTGTPGVPLTTVTILAEDELTLDVDTAGTGAKGLKAYIYVTRT